MAFAILWPVFLAALRTCAWGTRTRYVHTRSAVMSTRALDVSSPPGVGRPLGNESGAPEAKVPLEVTEPSIVIPPPRDVYRGGYVPPIDKVTWEPFQYASPFQRRATAREFARTRITELPALPPLKIVLVGGVSSGKGTIAPMLSQVFRTRVIGVGALLRGEARAGLPRGRAVAECMAAGKLLPDEVVLDLLRERISVTSSSSLFDGFPRTVAQATAMLDAERIELLPDAVILLERPDELIKEFALGRCFDSTTGHTYHPKYAPPPKEVHERLTWRVDDCTDTLDRRITQHNADADEIIAAFEAGGVPVRRVDNARSELATFEEVSDFLVEVSMNKIESKRDELQRDMASDDEASSAVVTLEEAAAVLRAEVPEDEDVVAVCNVDDDMDECVLRYSEETEAEVTSPLLAAVQRCNNFDLSDYMPVVVGDDQVGWARGALVDALAPALAIGTACEITTMKSDRGVVSVMRLAPQAQSEPERSSVAAVMIADLVADGFIPRRKVRNELQDVGPKESGFIGPGATPLLRMERAAIVPFGITRFGVHVNGWVRDKSKPDVTVPAALWVAKRAMSKATYPGLLDQMVAGGQPSGVSFAENVRKECAEEASLPAEALERIESTGLVNYRYTTATGLSSATLMTYDLEMPHGLLPLCADGEVEEFTLMPIADVLRSLREELPRWKPNAALVTIDFLIKRGFIDRHNEPEYEAITIGLMGRGFPG